MFESRGNRGKGGFVYRCVCVLLGFFLSSRTLSFTRDSRRCCRRRRDVRASERVCRHVCKTNLTIGKPIRRCSNARSVSSAMLRGFVHSPGGVTRIAHTRGRECVRHLCVRHGAHMQWPGGFAAVFAASSRKRFKTIKRGSVCGGGRSGRRKTEATKRCNAREFCARARARASVYVRVCGK